MKRNAFTLTEILIAIAILAIAALLLFPLFARARDEGVRPSTCQSNLKQIGLGFLQYTQDYNEKLPILTTEQGWVGALQPYVKSTQIFACPQEELRGADNLTDYWFNRRLAGINLEKIAETGSTFMGGDGEASDDPNVSIQILPPLWRTRENSPARRVLGTGNYLYVDGHVKALKPETITTRQFLVKP